VQIANCGKNFVGFSRRGIDGGAPFVILKRNSAIELPAA
jgi:hypothetical protein